MHLAEAATVTIVCAENWMSTSPVDRSSLRTTGINRRHNNTQPPEKICELRQISLMIFDIISSTVAPSQGIF